MCVRFNFESVVCVYIQAAAGVMFDGEMDCGRLWMEDTGCACFLWTGTTVTCLRVLYDDDCDENIAGDAMDCDNADDEEAITKKLSSYSDTWE